MIKITLTESDIRHLNICPDNKWFTEISVWPKIKRTKYSLGRLVERGLLKMEYKTSGNIYFKIPTITPNE